MKLYVDKGICKDRAVFFLTSQARQDSRAYGVLLRHGSKSPVSRYLNICQNAEKEQEPTLERASSCTAFCSQAIIVRNTVDPIALRPHLLMGLPLALFCYVYKHTPFPQYSESMHAYGFFDKDKFKIKSIITVTVHVPL